MIPITSEAGFFYWVLEKAALRRVRIHDLRHTFASRLIANGESLAYVRDQMGHSSIQVTVDIYGHLVPGSNKQAVDRLDEPVEKPETGQNPQLSATEGVEEAGDGGEFGDKVFDSQWSRRVGSNHRPADYETEQASFRWARCCDGFPISLLKSAALQESIRYTVSIGFILCKDF